LCSASGTRQRTWAVPPPLLPGPWRRRRVWLLPSDDDQGGHVATLWSKLWARLAARGQKSRSVAEPLLLPVWVASSAPVQIRHKLELTGLLDRFGKNLFSAAMVARGKPARRQAGVALLGWPQSAFAGEALPAGARDAPASARRGAVIADMRKLVTAIWKLV
jgi:hypothetical protein